MVGLKFLDGGESCIKSQKGELSLGRVFSLEVLKSDAKV